MAKEQTTAASNIEAVKMTDDRIVDFVGKRKLLKSSYVEDGNVFLRLDFRNGETRTYKLNPDLILQYAGHGAEQKFGDETAGLEDIDDMVLAVDELNDRVNGRGEWNVQREGGGIGGTSVLLRALIAYKESQGKTPSVEDIKKYLATKTQAEKMALRARPEIKPFVDAIEAEKASKNAKVNSDEIFKDFDLAA